jgi:hypothetical protein
MLRAGIVLGFHDFAFGSSIRGHEGIYVHLDPVRAVVNVHHWSRLSVRFPQCFSLRDGLNTRSTFLFKALMTPMRASIVGPPRATSISASIAVCHSSASCSTFGSFVM